jgi:hypothetical protein
MPKVLKHKRYAKIPPNAVYVGRPSKWGNPFVEGGDGSRAEVISKYERWLCDSPEAQALRNQIGKLKGKDLVCWCAPLPCHADLLLRLANAS